MIEVIGLPELIDILNSKIDKLRSELESARSEIGRLRASLVAGERRAQAPTYTVYKPSDGTVLGRGLSVAEAAKIILTHGGYEYELRPSEDAPGYVLYASKPMRLYIQGYYRYDYYSIEPYPRAPQLTLVCYPDKPVRSWDSDAARAWSEIAPQVVKIEWVDRLKVMTDAAYDEMITAKK